MGGDTFGSVFNLKNLGFGDALFSSTFASNIYTVAMNPAITATVQRGSFMFKAAATNTGAVQISDGAGTVSLFNELGGALVAGDIPAGAVCSVVWDAASGAYRMTEQVNSQMSATYATQAGLQAQAYNSATTSGTAPTYTATITPAPTLAAGLRVRAKFHAATSAASTLNLNALGAKSIKQYDATGAKVNATISANMLTDLEYDGTDWVVLNPINSAKAENFKNSKTANGWQKLEGGLIIQWGTVGFAASNTPAVQTTVAFPIAFPNACVHISGVQTSRASNDGGGTWAMRPTNKTLTNFLATLDNNGGSALYNFTLAQTAEWIAIGY